MDSKSCCCICSPVLTSDSLSLIYSEHLAKIGVQLRQDTQQLHNEVHKLAARVDELSGAQERQVEHARQKGFLPLVWQSLRVWAPQVDFRGKTDFVSTSGNQAVCTESAKSRNQPD
jgi:hypothetical protein